MLSWKEIVEKYITKHSDKIKKATRPLRDQLKVAYFTYHRIDKKGRYTVLVDRPDWAEHYVDAKFYLDDPYLRHPDVYRPGFCAIEANGSEEYKQRILKDGKEIFNLDVGIMLIEKHPEYVEFFGYAGHRAESGLDKLYLNHPLLLKSFGSHFKKMLQPILDQMENEAGFLQDLKGEDFHRKDSIHPDLTEEARFSYLKAIGKESEAIQASLLSVRERQCIKLLIAGKPAKETAQALGLSTRTIEFYFENIKNKLSCSSKQEVFSLGRDFEELGLL